MKANLVAVTDEPGFWAKALKRDPLDSCDLLAVGSIMHLGFR